MGNLEWFAVQPLYGAFCEPTDSPLLVLLLLLLQGRSKWLQPNAGGGTTIANLLITITHHSSTLCMRVGTATTQV